MFSLFRKCKSKSVNHKLLQAVQEDNLKGVQKALSQKGDVHMHSGKLREPLILTAVKYASLPVIEELIKAKINPNDYDLSFQTALIEACEKRKYDMVLFLLDNGAKPNMTNKDGFTALDVIFRHLPRRIYSANTLFNAGKSFFFEKDLKPEADIVQKLLEKGASLKQTKKSDDMPLITAVRSLNKYIIKLVLKQNIDVNAATSYLGDTALITACEIRPPQLSNTIIQLLLNAGADLNKPAQNGDTPLLYAVKNNNPSITKQLIAAGADVNKQDTLGKTALMIATMNGNYEIVQMLIKANADVNKQDKNGNTALLMALTSEIYTPEMFKVIQLLIKHNSNTSLQNNYKETAWDILLKEANPRILLFIQNVITQIQTKQASCEEMLEKLNQGIDKLIEINKNNFRKCVWSNTTPKNVLMSSRQHINQ